MCHLMSHSVVIPRNVIIRSDSSDVKFHHDLSNGDSSYVTLHSDSFEVIRISS